MEGPGETGGRVATSGSEVVVVGGGPAGSSAAIACALHGAKAVIVDRRPRVGVPVQCGEGYTPIMGELSIVPLPERLTKWTTRGTTFIFDGERRSVDGRMWSTNMVDRAELDGYLYERAARLGARRIEGEVADFDGSSLYLSDGRKVPYERLIIADGADSLFLDPGDKRRGVAYVKSYEVRGEIPEPLRSTMFINDYCEKGYGYIFPKGKSSANIGLGGLVSPAELDRKFEEFREEPMVKRLLKSSEVVAEKSGYAPLFECRMRKDLHHAIRAGDAANHNLKPFVEGFITGSVYGYLAGAAMSLRPVEEAKRRFDELAQAYIGDILSEAQRSFQALCDEWDVLGNREIVERLMNMDFEHAGWVARTDWLTYQYTSMAVRRRRRRLKKMVRFPDAEDAERSGTGRPSPPSE